MMEISRAMTIAEHTIPLAAGFCDRETRKGGEKITCVPPVPSRPRASPSTLPCGLRSILLSLFSPYKLPLLALSTPCVGQVLPRVSLVQLCRWITWRSCLSPPAVPRQITFSQHLNSTMLPLKHVGTPSLQRSGAESLACSFLNPPSVLRGPGLVFFGAFAMFTTFTPTADPLDTKLEQGTYSPTGRRRHSAMRPFGHIIKPI
ncbi:uncharacterized protein GLRG_11827 [Colletotrichum graminicola M1.001]|uniref:Uncharacterized protein n=1 Tax=Colletotrichum graminicola (strain M1.001 / M2 / FGSC 10212) TaxID=645133 RepID=E3R0P3_COLGM|nr:uncharacterized protein GLRG_11827 [Colletotrichum graminicola M1.001]EFQ36681.1 hypothetical protein GLRG_11827 [Colletotrichum graminicola M1.001]